MSSTTEKGSDVEIITEKTKTRPVTTLRPPAVRSETVPRGFKGKTDDKDRKHAKKSSKLFDKDAPKPDTFVSVTKSVTGSLDGDNNKPNEDKKFASTYYTKSSTCGYFTFSCNVVYGSNGRSKICRPKEPVDGKC